MLTCLAATLLLATPASAGATAAADPLGRGAWLLDATENAVLLVTPRAGVERFTGCDWPSQVAVDASGAAWVSCRGSGEVRRLTSHQPARSFAVGAEPSALALDVAARRLYVGLSTSAAVVVLDLDSGRELARADVGVEPTALGLFGGGLVVGSRKSAALQVHPRGLDAPPERVKLPVPESVSGAPMSVGAELLVPVGEQLAVISPVAELGRVEQPTYYASETSGGSPLTQNVLLLEAGTRLKLKRLGNLVLPDVAAARFDARLRELHLASRSLGGLVSLNVDTRAVNLRWNLSPGTVAVADDGQFTFALDDAARTVALRVSSLDRPCHTLRSNRPGARAEPAGCEDGRTERLALGGAEDAELARGRKLFHLASDSRVAGVALSCASCHRDGRDDGRTWAGEGALRQTPMLAGRAIADTAPYSWSGRYARLEEYLQFTITSRMQGTGLGRKDLAALARYVREGLRPVALPAVADADAVAQGRAVFHSDATGCASCHPSSEAFTDGARHDVGSLSALERQQALRSRAPAFREISEGPPPPPFDPPQLLNIGFSPSRPIALPGPQRRAVLAVSPELRFFDTPSLLRVSLTAPYLHDGSAQTLDGVFSRLEDHMGKVSGLSPAERAALVAYLRTL
ncbi:MAG: hypothetical protein IPJ65_12685 [Archangiaceae bacterium]|nr:hypothetical protein [Archangiaceae bacterium]